MHMTVRDAVDRLPRQTGEIVILDLIGLCVEEIEDVELQPHPIVELIAGAGVDDERRQRADAVVLDQRARAEIAGTQAAEPAGIAAEGNAAAGDPARRPRNEIAD